MTAFTVPFTLVKRPFAALKFTTCGTNCKPAVSGVRVTITLPTGRGSVQSL